jgi:Flp pilus assembly protein TadB
MWKLKAYIAILLILLTYRAALVHGKRKIRYRNKKDNNLVKNFEASVNANIAIDEPLNVLQQNNSLQKIEINKSNIHEDSERLHKLLKLLKRNEEFSRQNEAIGMQWTMSTIELECKFGNFSDLSVFIFIFIFIFLLIMYVHLTLISISFHFILFCIFFFITAYLCFNLIGAYIRARHSICECHRMAQELAPLRENTR